jgi:hypothetical protein
MASMLFKEASGWACVGAVLGLLSVNAMSLFKKASGL